MCSWRPLDQSEASRHWTVRLQSDCTERLKQKRLICLLTTTLCRAYHAQKTKHTSFFLNTFQIVIFVFLNAINLLNVNRLLYFKIRHFLYLSNCIYHTLSLDIGYKFYISYSFFPHSMSYILIVKRSELCGFSAIQYKH